MDQEWVEKMLGKLAQIGCGPQGINRLAYSDADMHAKEFMIRTMRDNGLTVRVDSIGNIIGRLEGTVPDASIVATGSHLDTVPDAGRYDGALGVVGGLAAIRRLQSLGPLQHPVELIIFAAAESSRFGLVMIGSKAMAGMASRYAWGKAKDSAGISLAEALETKGFGLNDLDKVARVRDSIKAFVELHIEQGTSLEKTKKQIGIIETVAAPTMIKVTINGETGHTGSIPMEERHDALVSAATIVLAVQSIALDQSPYGTLATVGQLTTAPGTPNVIPSQVELWIDLRGVDQENIIDTIQEIKDAVSTITDEQETLAAIDMLFSEKPIQMDEYVIRKIETACLEKNISFRRMNSAGGHDAMNMAHLAPAGIIFIPCKGGISHSPREFADPADIMAGIDILTQTLYELAK
ncbi:MAG: amidase, hydantoinase/carbamoylase family [Firmicutes bacterium]|nr:amidase, hydantoinase/carbamoylase family [Bacillota bacterium]